MTNFTKATLEEVVQDLPPRDAAHGAQLAEHPLPATWCPEASKLMVAMPGMAWTRDDE